MTRRHFRDFVPPTTITESIDTSDLTVDVASLVGWPTARPFVGIIDRNESSAEVVLVTGVSGTQLTITRDFNGLGAFSHSANAKFEHPMIAADLDEPNAHINANTGVHGVAGAVVGTTDEQTLFNKTIVDATFEASGGAPGAVFSAAAHTDNAFVVHDETNSDAVVAKIDGAGKLTAGDASLTGNAAVAGTLGVTGKLTAAGAVEIDGAATVTGLLGAAGGLGVQGGATINGTTAVGALAASGNAAVGGTLGVTGKITGNGSAQLNGGVGVAGGLSASNGTTLFDGAAVTGGLTADHATVTADVKVGGELLDAGGKPIYLAGNKVIAFTGQSTKTGQTVDFSKDFEDVPSLSFQVISGAGVAIGWGVLVIDSSVSGFTFRLDLSGALNGNVSVNWQAFKVTEA